MQRNVRAERQPRFDDAGGVGAGLRHIRQPREDPAQIKGHRLLEGRIRSPVGVDDRDRAFRRGALGRHGLRCRRLRCGHLGERLGELALADDRHPELTGPFRLARSRGDVRRNDDAAALAHSADVEPGRSGPARPFFARDRHGPGERHAITRAQMDSTGEITVGAFTGTPAPSTGVAAVPAHHPPRAQGFGQPHRRRRPPDGQFVGDGQQLLPLLRGDHAIRPRLDGHLFQVQLVELGDVVVGKLERVCSGQQLGDFVVVEAVVDHRVGQQRHVLVSRLIANARSGVGDPANPLVGAGVAVLLAAPTFRAFRILAEQPIVTDQQRRRRRGQDGKIEVVEDQGLHRGEVVGHPRQHVFEQARGGVGVGQRRVRCGVRDADGFQAGGELVRRARQNPLRRAQRVQQPGAVLRQLQPRARELLGQKPLLERRIVGHDHATVEKIGQPQRDVLELRRLHQIRGGDPVHEPVVEPTVRLHQGPPSLFDAPGRVSQYDPHLDDPVRIGKAGGFQVDDGEGMVAHGVGPRRFLVGSARVDE